MYTVYCKSDSVHCILYKWQFFLNTVPCSLHSVHCTWYSVEWSTEELFSVEYIFSVRRPVVLLIWVVVLQCTLYNVQFMMTIRKITVYSGLLVYWLLTWSGWWLDSVQCKVYRVQCTVYRVQCTVYSVQCTVYSVQCTVYSVQCTVYSVQCTVYSVQCTGYSVECNLECTANSAVYRLQCSVKYTVYRKYIDNRVLKP